MRVLLLLAVLVLVALCAATWLLTTSGGAKLVLSQVTRAAGGGIRYEGVEGSLGGPMKIKLIEVDRADMYARVEDFEMDSSPWAPLTGRLVIHRLEAGKVEVRTVSTGAAAQVPVSFAPPYALTLERGHVGELRLGALTREAAAEKDRAKKRALMDAMSATDLVVKEIALRGSGDASVWKVEEAAAATPIWQGPAFRHAADARPLQPRREGRGRRRGGRAGLERRCRRQGHAHGDRGHPRGPPFGPARDGTAAHRAFRRAAGAPARALRTRRGHLEACDRTEHAPQRGRAAHRGVQVLRRTGAHRERRARPVGSPAPAVRLGGDARGDHVAAGRPARPRGRARRRREGRGARQPHARGRGGRSQGGRRRPRGAARWDCRRRRSRDTSRPPAIARRSASRCS
jgi:hypothetical protein